jgi:solute carrier family 10 (sodium/bile acid cotransporter), member 7
VSRFFGKNWFLIGILTALVLGFLIPDIGVSLNTGSVFSTVLIVVLFLISGLKLPTESIKSGLKTYKLHVFIQTFIFVLSPLYFFITGRLFADTLDGALVVGLYALACLPTTISSCIIFTQSADGNVVGAMFNAAFANVIGVFLSPIILSILLRSSGNGLPLSELLGILQSLALKMLLPIIIGQVARRYIKSWVDANKKRLSVASNLAILMIVFFAFAKTAANPDFVSKLPELALPFVYLAASHLVLVGLTWIGARFLKLDRADVATVLFTAPQKTLAMGVPLLTTFFGANASLLGVALLPLVFYHPWQLLVAGVITRFLNPAKK